MASTEFTRTYEQALGLIGHYLRLTALEFGPVDFPEDRGVVIRNRLFAYPYGLFLAMRHYAYEEPEDPWAVAYGDKVTMLGHEALSGLAAHCHFFIEAHHSRRASFRYARVVLDWLGNTYQTGPDMPARWHALMTGVSDFGVFCEQAERLLYRGITRTLTRDPCDSIDQNLWGGLAFAGAMVAPKSDDFEWQSRTDRWFDEPA